MAKKPPPGGLNVVPETATITVGATQFVFCSDPAASWSSSNPAIASMDGLVRGAVLGVSPGGAVITARRRNKTGTMTITVEAVDVPPVDPGTYGPQTDVTQPPGSVTILPGVSSIQDVIAAHPAGTTYWLSAGTYPLRVPLTPKAGDSFLGAYGAILTGGDTAAAAMTPAVDGVTVRNLIVEHFANPVQYGALSAEGRTGWTFAYNETRLNFGYGIRCGPASHVIANAVHHNGQLGIGGAWADDVLIDGNEIAYNNTNGNDPGWEAGGTKFTNTNRLIVRGNYVHHNSGPGLWTDINNLDTLYELNTVDDNTMMGIFHEISYACIIRNNVVRRNGLAFTDWIWGAGILVAASPDVEIYGNTLEGNADGIGAAQQDRSGDPATHGPHEIANLYVHDNDVTSASGWIGLVQDVNDVSYFSSRNNRFLANTYHVAAGDARFTWDNQELTLAQWQAKGLQ